MRSDRQRLLDILESIAAIRRHSHGGRDAIDSDELVRTSIIHWIGVIGEAASRVSDELRSAHPEVPWAEITAMRNRLFHAYFDVSADRVWEAVEHDLPDLDRKVRNIVSEHPEGSDSDA